jgi:tRNA threonylcarbamoyladenosine biosynthesis protein TsaB
MIVLAVDTSSGSGSVALRSEGRLIGEVRVEDALQHSRTLFRSIELVLEAGGVKVDEVGMLVAARGPGSFTGLRVGLAALGGLAFVSGREARAVSTLAAWAWQAPPGPALIAPLLDARRGDVYSALYRRANGSLEEVAAPRVSRPEEFLRSVEGEAVVFVGPAVTHCSEEIRRSASWSLGDAEPWLAPVIAEMAEAGYQEAFEPLYLRAPTLQPPRPRPEDVR